MSNLDTTASDNQFNNALINRFFNAKSYFYSCASKFLENPSLLDIYADPSIIKQLSKLINNLINAKQPASEIKEITLIQGFGDVYSNLEMQLIRYDLRSLEQPQLKKAIRNIALNFVVDVYQALQNNEQGQKTLRIYLELREELNTILNGSNGHKSDKNEEDIQDKNNVEYSTHLEEQIEEFSTPDAGEDSYHSVKKETSRDNINLLKNYFEKEVTQLLRPLDMYSDNISEFYTDSNFIRLLHKNFSRIQGLANSHNYEEVEVISNRVSQLMLSILSMKDSISQQIIELIYDAKSAIEKMLINNKKIKNFNELLTGLEHAISLFNNTEQNQVPQNGESVSTQNSEEQETTSFEINPSFNSIEKSTVNNHQKRDISSIFSGFHSENYFSKKVDSLKLSGDDDEELLKLVQDVDFKNFSSLPDHSQNTDDIDNACFEKDNFIENDNPEYSIDESDKLVASSNELFQIEDADNESPRDNSVEEVNPEGSVHELDNLDQSTIELFQGEAELYYKILLSAITQLKNEEKIQIALEDIELASSSLKYLAQKFGMDKLAALPELLELISIVANKHTLQIPQPVLQGIEDGVNLLKDFEPINADHKTKFMSILAQLKEFYSIALDKTTKILATSDM